MQNFPDQVSNLCLLQWKLGVLTTGLPGKSKIPVSNNKLYKSGIIVWLLFKCPLGRINSFSQQWTLTNVLVGNTTDIRDQVLTLSFLSVSS